MSLFSPESVKASHFPNVGERPAEIERDIENFAADDAHQLSLRPLNLVMQSAHHIFLRVRVVVLHECVADAELSKSTLVVTLQKEAAVVAEHFGFEQQNSGQAGEDFFH